MTLSRLLVVTAVEAERDAAAAALLAAPSLLGPYPTLTATTPSGRVDLLAGGVGCAAAGAATATALSLARYSLVLSAGIGGGFGDIPAGSCVVSSAIVHADLGADSDEGFLAADTLGLGAIRHEVAARLAAELAARTSARLGAILTVSTVTGTAAGAAALTGRHPDAVAEGMEGAGVAAAAHAHGVSCAELRTISNRVGPRDRTSWQLAPALSALTIAVGAICAQPLAAAGETTGPGGLG